MTDLKSQWLRWGTPPHGNIIHEDEYGVFWQDGPDTNYAAKGYWVGPAWDGEGNVINRGTFVKYGDEAPMTDLKAIWLDRIKQAMAIDIARFQSAGLPPRAIVEKLFEIPELEKAMDMYWGRSRKDD